MKTIKEHPKFKEYSDVWNWLLRKVADDEMSDPTAEKVFDWHTQALQSERDKIMEKLKDILDKDKFEMSSTTLEERIDDLITKLQDEN